MLVDIKKDHIVSPNHTSAMQTTTKNAVITAADVVRREQSALAALAKDR
jgi:hypothetical protein